MGSTGKELGYIVNSRSAWATEWASALRKQTKTRDQKVKFSKSGLIYYAAEGPGINLKNCKNVKI